MPEKNTTPAKSNGACIDVPLFDPKADSPLSDEALREKRDRYAHFNAETVLPRIVWDTLAATVCGVESLGTGANAFDHLVFRVQTNDGRRVVCRINADPLVATHFPIETALYHAWRSAGIPSPEVYSVVLRKEPGDIDYMLLECVGATDLEKHTKAHPENVYILAHAAGAFLARLHTIPVPGFGMLEYNHGALRGKQPSWREAVLLRLEETLSYLLQHKIISTDKAETITGLFKRHAKHLEFANGVALHGDYHDANILLNENATTVVAAIDLSQAKAGDPLYDIAFYGTYATAEKFKSFCNGYFANTTLPPEVNVKVALYQLRIYLSKAKLRKRFGYDDRIQSAINGINTCITTLST